MLITALEAQTVLNTLTTQYVRKLAKETKRLNIRNTIRKHETKNLHIIIKKRKERKKGKQAVLKGYFHISTEELCIVVKLAEKDTKEQVVKKSRKGGKVIIDITKSNQEVKEEVEE